MTAFRRHILAVAPIVTICAYLLASPFAADAKVYCKTRLIDTSGNFSPGTSMGCYVDLGGCFTSHGCAASGAGCNFTCEECKEVGEPCPPPAPTAAASTPAAPEARPSVLKDPLGSTDIRELVARAIRIFTGISGSLALLMFVYGGFLWVTSGGNADKVKQGQKAFVNASIGLIIIFTAYIVISAIFKVLAGTAL